jgi:phytoene desaturase
MKKAVIIGSGFGGLASAIRLRARGMDVTLLEKNAKVGGHAYQLKKDGYTFDMGPSLITAPDIIENVFQAAGRTMEDYLELLPLDPFYRIYFHDKTFIDYTGDPEKIKQEMRKYNTQDADNYDAFMEASKGIYDAVITDGLGSTPFMDLKTMFSFIPKALKLKALHPAHHLVTKFFKDFRHRFMFSFHPLFIGGSPFRSPAVYLMIPYLERKGGVWFTEGGMYSVVEAFEKVFLELGGTIRTQAEVQEITITNGKATGVQVGNEYLPADAVVSNADIIHTYKDLIPQQHRKRWTNGKIQRTKYSMGAFLMYIGVKKQYPELLHHTLILSERYKELVKDIFDNHVLPEDFSMYLHVPTRTDADMAPEGCESMYVLIPVTNMKADIDWNAIKQKYADTVIDYLENEFGMEDFRKNIEVLELFTPADFAEQRNSYLGSAWGVEPHFLQTAYFRPHNRSEDIDNLYFVGAGTHPGAGVPGVLLSSEATEKVIAKDMGLESSPPISVMA